MKKRTCAHEGCGKLIQSSSPLARFCSRACAYAAWYAKPANRKAHIARQEKRRRKRIRTEGKEAIRAEWREHQRAHRKRLKVASRRAARAKPSRTAQKPGSR
jgi:hypothetical protein